MESRQERNPEKKSNERSHCRYPAGRTPTPYISLFHPGIPLLSKEKRWMIPLENREKGFKAMEGLNSIFSIGYRLRK